MNGPRYTDVAPRPTPAATASPRETGEIKSLTGLRGVAALLIVISHFAYWAAVTPERKPPGWLAPWLSIGAVGMAIFFTLSGYVIALSYGSWDWRQRPLFNLTRFLLYRFARLYPAFFLFAALIVLRNSSLQMLSRGDVQAYLAPHLLLCQSWFPEKFDGALACDDRFHVSWSLSTEFGLYIMFAGAAIVAARTSLGRRKNLILGSLSAVLLSGALLLAWQFRARIMPAGWSDKEWRQWLFYVSPYSTALEFAVGVAAFRWGRTVNLKGSLGTALSNAGLLGLIMLYVGGSTRLLSMETFLEAMAVAVAVGLVLVASSAESLANRLLSGRAIVYVGTISYSLYLFHFAIPAIAFHGEFPMLTPTAAAYFASNFLFSIAASIMFAAGVYNLVEVPGRRFIRRAADKLLRIQRAEPVVKHERLAAA